MLSTFFKCSLVLLPIFLSACAPRSTQQASSLIIKKPVSGLQCYAISGGIAARSKAQSFSASMNWQQKGALSYKIRLFGPLGGGALMIERQGDSVQLKDAHELTRSNDAEALLAQKTKVHLPVHNLYYWVRGLKAPGAAQQTFNQNHELMTLKQNGYIIQYGDYTEVDGYVLPGQIKLVGKDVFAKLIIKRWYIC